MATLFWESFVERPCEVGAMAKVGENALLGLPNPHQIMTPQSASSAPNYAFEPCSWLFQADRRVGFDTDNDEYSNLSWSSTEYSVPLTVNGDPVSGAVGSPSPNQVVLINNDGFQGPRKAGGRYFIDTLGQASQMTGTLLIPETTAPESQVFGFVIFRSESTNGEDEVVRLDNASELLVLRTDASAGDFELQSFGTGHSMTITSPFAGAGSTWYYIKYGFRSSDKKHMLHVQGDSVVESSAGSTNYDVYGADWSYTMHPNDSSARMGIAASFFALDYPDSAQLAAIDRWVEREYPYAFNQLP